jgi:acyl-CoA dehydrogenase family member 9
MSNNENIINSVAGDLFYGDINESSVFPFPKFSTDQSEMASEMVNAVARFAEEQIDSEKLDTNQAIPDEITQGLAMLGLCGLAVPESYGGMELDYSLYSRVFSEVAGFDGSIATMLGAHQSIGYRALLNEGTEEQKQKWLPKLASGEMLASFCLTEPSSGSDAYSIKTKAVKNEDGNYILNGQKLWITNAGTAGFYTVFCKTDHEIEGKTVEKISCFVVTKDMPGVTFGEKEQKMGIKASETRAVYFDNVIVPADNMIGAPGKGFKISMNVLNSGRLSLGSASVGAMKKIIHFATEHTKNRKQFDKNLFEFGLIQEKIADMSAICYATECAVYMTSGNMVKGMHDYSIESAICKVFGSEALWSVIDMGMQIAGGTGYMKEYPYERSMRDARINLIFEGTNEILRCFIALSGVKGPSENLKELGKISDVSSALSDPIKSLGVLTDFAKNRLSKMISSKALSKAHPSLESQSTHFSSMLSDFAIHVENSLIKYGRNIIDRELVLKRIANMSIELYVTLAVISRTTLILNNEKIEQEEKDFVLNLAFLSCRRSKHKFKSNNREMGNNLDSTIKKVSDYVCKDKAYNLDIINY